VLLANLVALKNYFVMLFLIDKAAVNPWVHRRFMSIQDAY